MHVRTLVGRQVTRGVVLGAVVYVALYLCLSRMGFRWAKLTGDAGFFFVPPTNNGEYYVNKAL